jgi:integrase
MKAAFNQAILEDIIPSTQNPFFKFKVKQVPTNKQKLSVEEIDRITALTLEPGSSLSHTRNCFMFSFYCGGIRAGDIITMRWRNVNEGSLAYVMAKNTNSKLTTRTVPLIPEAKAILLQYKSNDSKPEDFIFRELKNEISKLISDEKKLKSGFEKTIYNQIASRNTIFNKNLKKIAKLADITKPLTFHIARHSFAQFAMNKDMTPKMLQTILGHEKFATTETYISTLQDKKIEDAMLKIFTI